MRQIKLKNISLKYFGIEALRIPELELSGSLGLVGCSGSGKTNFLKVLAGIEYIYSGEIYIDGEEISYKKIRDRNFALLSKETPLFNNKSVYYNLEYPLKKHGEKKEEIKNKVLAALEQQGIKDGEQKVKTLTRNQRTDVLLARSMIKNPFLLLIDEPVNFIGGTKEFNNSAAKYLQSRKEGRDDQDDALEYFRDKIKATAKERQIIYATYDFDQVKDICNSFLILRDGKIEAFGTLEDIKNHPSAYVRKLCFPLD